MAKRLVLVPILLMTGTAASVASDAPTNAITVSETLPLSMKGWILLETGNLLTIEDDDIRRHNATGEDWGDITVHEKRLSENGYNWDLLRFSSKLKPHGPLWVVPHDDENAAFDAAIIALRVYGGVAIVINSGPGASRNMPGYGPCGVRSGSVANCDPNRNFSDRTPLYSAAFLDQWQPGQPIIALHTNTPGFAGDGHGGYGQITVLDTAAAKRGEHRPARNAYFGNGIVPRLNNYDSFPLMPFRASDGSPKAKDVACRTALNATGVHFWHERVGASDGSLSNYVVLNRPEITYINIESRQEADLKIASDRHMAVLASMWAVCGGYFVKD